MNAYKLKKEEEGIEKVKNLLKLSCHFKITNKIVEEVS